MDNSIYLILLLPAFYLGGWIMWYFRFNGIPEDTPKIISFHKISNKPELGGTFCTVGQFKSYMNYIAGHDYSTVSLDRLIEERKDKEMAVFFDDAYEDVYEKAFPIMQDRGLKGVICPVAGFIGRKNHWDRGPGSFRHMNRKQILELSEAGFDIVSHSITHPDLRKLPSGELMRELTDSRKILEDLTGRSIDYFIYPYGLYNERVKHAVKKVGYSAAFTSYNENNAVFDRFAIGRNTMYIIDSVIDLKIIMNRGPLFCYGHEEAKGRIINWFARFSRTI
ncbi:MAG: polysaccharide deacetylase family protein [candidate division WOR-3 bacterium]|nr:polysaccharide deacetylase family protein [candidate division WOR-3 bacterium]